ncbi:MAG: hypothetical protein WA948_06435 [Pontixanthobacter sp.]
MRFLDDFSDGEADTIAPMASARLKAAVKLINRSELTKKQREGVHIAIDAWTALCDRRVFLAHGESKALIDHSDTWHVLIDAPVSKNKAIEVKRWALTEDEALAFESRLQHALTGLANRMAAARQWNAAASADTSSIGVTADTTRPCDLRIGP